VAAEVASPISLIDQLDVAEDAGVAAQVAATVEEADPSTSVGMTMLRSG
jgi:hypothetical protein